MKVGLMYVRFLGTAAIALAGQVKTKIGGEQVFALQILSLLPTFLHAETNIYFDNGWIGLVKFYSNL